MQEQQIVTTNQNNDQADFVQVRGLKTYFATKQANSLFGQQRTTLKAVDGVDFTIPRGTTLGLVGESGSGKSTVARSVLQLIKPTAGEVIFEGTNLCQLKPAALRPLRQRMQIIFQDPYASLDPRQTIGFTVAEPLILHKICERKQLRQRVRELLEMVGLNPDFENRYPYEFSGGQRQRVGIARALATNPDFVVADEPISALDISIQAQILNLLRDLQTRLHLTYLFISHDLRAVRYLSDEVAVMYLGKIVEIAPTAQIFEQPRHPYTQGLLQSVPVARWQKSDAQKKAVEGEVPGLAAHPTGCAFASRCSHVMDRCRREVPQLKPIGAKTAQKAACFLVHPD
jgi:oligopeptide/dipeptide ABC transporter ATP-binding protein